MRLVVIGDSLISQEKTKFRIVNSHRKKGNSAVMSAIISLGHKADYIESDFALVKKLHEIKPQFAFNRSIRKLQGATKSYAPSVLEKFKIPFTGPSAKVCADASNKLSTIRILQLAGIDTPKSFQIRNLDEMRIPTDMEFPLFIKPIEGGSSIGISKENLILDRNLFKKRIINHFKRFKKPILIQEFISGREFSVGILGNANPQVLPIREFQYQDNYQKYPAFRTYYRKMINYKNEQTVCPAILNDKLRIEIEQIAMNTFMYMGCKDYARIDIRLNKNGRPFVLDVNYFPDLLPDESSFAIMAKAAGLSFTLLIEKILIVAASRFNISKNHLLSQ